VKSSAIFIALRRLRAPIIVLVLVYALGVVGFVLIPGVDAEGRPWRMDMFHAFYVISYTATTIGFGELPYAFTDAQRMWTVLVIYLSVFGWTYALGSLLALGRDRAFQQALSTQRFARGVHAIAEPFYVVCGYGETGGLVCAALDRAGLRVVVLEQRAERLAELDLQDFRSKPYGLNADARSTDALRDAGLGHPQLRGVLALTNDDEVNLKVAIAVRLLSPGVPVLARVRNKAVAANMASFGTDHIINPFTVFGQYLSLLLRAPQVYRLLDRLIGSAASPEPTARPLPRGHWIVCGYGRFGREVVACFDREGLDVTIIEPDPKRAADRTALPALGTEADHLHTAGIESAVGIVAGTDDDVDNLSIAVTAREIRPDIYVVVRQNEQANSPLFAALEADFTVVSRAIVSEHAVALVRTPRLARFIERVTTTDEAAGATALARLDTAVGPRKVTTWRTRLHGGDSPAIERALGRGQQITIEHLLREPGDRRTPLHAVALMLFRGDEEMLLPAPSLPLVAGDEILFAGTAGAHDRQGLILADDNVRDYVVLGRDIPGGWVWQWFGAKSLPLPERRPAEPGGKAAR
jgi:Trk K+ transport system NAD-binding subunit